MSEDAEVAAPDVAGVELLEWVTDVQEVQLQALVGGTWREQLPEALDLRWPEWRNATPDVLQPWLDEQLPTLFADSDGAADDNSAVDQGPAVVDELDWLRIDQRETIEAYAARGDPHEWLVAALDNWWPDWRQASPESRAQALDQLLPSLVTALPEDQHANAGSVPLVDALAWVTPSQQALLETVAPGDWRGWLTPRLDEVWPEWTQAAPDALQPWLDQWLPNLLQGAAEGVTPAGSAATPSTSVDAPEAAESPSASAEVSTLDSMSVEEVNALIAQILSATD